MRNIRPLALFAGAALTHSAYAQDTATLPPPPVEAPIIAAAPAPLPCCVIAAGTLVDIEITEALNSKTSQIGAMFGIKTAAPIKVGDVVIVPAGATGQGQVIHAAKARAAGKPGELIIAARYVEQGGVRIPLRTFRYGPSVGKNNVETAAAVGIIVATPLILIITGGQIDVPIGTKANAKVAADTQISTVKSDATTTPLDPTNQPTSNGGK